MLDGVAAKRHIGNAESQSTNQSGFLPSLTPNSEHLISPTRYHGKASDLHLLGDKDRIDRRNEGGIWRFPKRQQMTIFSLICLMLRHRNTSSIYISHTCTHPSQLFTKRLFLMYSVLSQRTFHNREIANSLEKCFDSLRNHGQQRTPTLLLLAMYAIAIRYSSGNDVLPKLPDGKILWVAGNEYLDRAKVILNGSYANSRISTCQALLLMGYREIGVGAMAQAWIYVGMAIRMAHDLDLHRRADGWVREGLGGRLFNEWGLRERNRVWYACVIMDKYLSTYIGRPLSIFESDYDTPLPSEDEFEEFEEWSPPGDALSFDGEAWSAERTKS